jgi:hypothetical protein
MDVHQLQDRIYWGLNRAGNILGRATDAYRPVGASNPLDRGNRYLQLYASFGRADGDFGQAVGYEVAVWRGYFDASYTRVGDYLVHEHDVWFIAAQHSLLPVLCVKTNHVISVSRQIAPTPGSLADTASAHTNITLISGWPASLLGTGTEGRPSTQLPGDTRIPSVTALLPSVHEQKLQPADIITDEYGTIGIVVAAELSDLGWLSTAV